MSKQLMDHQNHHRSSATPGAACRLHADLLPTLDEPGVNRRRAAAARAHLATCAWCQAQRATYDDLDERLRGTFTGMQLPTVSAAEIVGVAPAIVPTIARWEARVNQPDQTAPQGSPVRTEATLLRERDVTDASHTGASHTGASSPQRHTSRHTRRRMLSGLGALAAVVLLAIVAQSLFTTLGQQRPHTGQGNVSTLPPFETYKSLYSVSMVSPDEGWAYGAGYPDTSGSKPRDRNQGILLHDSGGKWTSVPVPWTPATDIGICSLPTRQMISMSSATDGWLATGDGRLAHYDGHAWQLSNTMPSDMLACDIEMLSPSLGWAIVLHSDTMSPAVLRFDGHTWRPEQLDLPAQVPAADMALSLRSIQMQSAHMGWVVGQFSPANGITSTIILQYADGVWKTISLLPHIALDVTFVSADQAWATGETETVVQEYFPAPGEASPTYQPMVETQPVIMRDQHGRWSQYTDPSLPYEANYFQISMVSATDGWIVAHGGDGWNLLHYDGAHWTPVILPTIANRSSITINDITMLSSGNGWLVGDGRWTESLNYPYYPSSSGISTSGNPYPITPIILHFHDGVWSVAYS